MRRVLASFMLAGLALSYGTPLLGGSAADCPPVAGTEFAQLVVTNSASCEHIDAASCVATLGCVASASATQARCAGFKVPNPVTVIGSLPWATIRDLFHTRPPTPPPNLI